MKFKSIALALAGSCLIAACGGGGSDAPPDAVARNSRSGASAPGSSLATHPFPVAALMNANAVEVPGAAVQYTFTATGIDGSTYQLSVVRTTLAGTEVFNGVAATPTIVTEELKKNGNSVVFVSSRIEYTDPAQSNKPVGIKGTGVQEFTVTRVDDVSTLQLLPTTATVGQFGPLPIGLASINNSSGQEAHFWSVEADTDSSLARVCERIEAPESLIAADVYSTYPRINCLRVNTNDAVVGATITLRYQNEDLVFRR